jgi:glucose-6-phosphate 1-dehydrogenase
MAKMYGILTKNNKDLFMNHITFLIIGLSGDLARRKLLPAIYHLIKNNKIQSFLLFGIGRETTDTKTIFQHVRPFITNIDESAFQKLKRHSSYQQLDIFDKAACSEFVTHIAQKENELHLEQQKTRIVYCATASTIFSEITTFVTNTQFIRPGYDDDKIVFEKPFGTSLQNAQEINSVIQAHLSENNVFRVDHYLTKELVRALVNLRFSNSVFEPLLNNNFVEQVHIIATEQIGIEGRAFYYDRYGAIQDMIQNHLLSLFSLLIFEKPEKLDPLSLAKARSESIKTISCVDGILGQYEGYLQEIDIQPNSRTETFATLTFFVEDNRWRTVPFLLKTGKYLDKKETAILIKFKPLFSGQEPNWLKIQISPEAILSLSLHLRSPRTGTEMVTVPMEFCHSCTFSDQIQEAYEHLLDAIIRGDKAVAVQQEEIESSWDIIEHILERKFPLHTYQKGSIGPAVLESFYKKYHFDTK